MQHWSPAEIADLSFYDFVIQWSVATSWMEADAKRPRM